MKSIKPGRGPSMMGGVGGIFTALFGIIWTVAASNMGAPVFFSLFGVIFIIYAVVIAVYNFKNATGKKRYSAFDIVDSKEESDPWNENFSVPPQQPTAEAEANYCPYCGAAAAEDFEFCAKCGRKLP